METVRFTPPMRDLSPLLRPRSIAMVGASSDPARGNGRTLRYLIQGGFSGELFAVNPRRDDVQGLKSWPSISALPLAVDCAIVALPADTVTDALRDCAKAGTRSAVVFAGGFAEVGEAGRAAQAEMTQVARDAGMLLLGPNSLGAYDARSKSFMTFSSMFEEGFGGVGRIGMVTQSGGWGSQARRLAADRDMHIVQWVSTGNEADVDVAEVLQSMTHDDEIDVILLYLEGVRDGKRLREALEAARVARKPVAAIKVGRTRAGQAAAASHTASLTGEDSAFDALCLHFGVHRADSIEELLDVAYAALHAVRHGRMPKGRRTVVLSPSGGFAVHMTDQAMQLGLEMPPTPDPVRRAVLEMAPHASLGNPVDVTGQVLNRIDDFGRTLGLLLGGDHYDAADVFVGMAGSAPALRDQWVSTLAAAARAHPGKWLGVSVVAPEATLKQYEDAGFAVFQDTSRLMNAHAALVSSAMAFERATEDVPARAAFEGFAEGATSEVAAKRVLAALGVAVPRERLCGNASEAGRAAQELGGSVAVKAVSPDIPHKTEAGGVVLGVHGAAAVETAVNEMAQRLRTYAPQARIEGYLVSQMAPAGVDCLVGLRVDPAMGPVVVFGAGGVMAEWLEDVSVRLAPVGVQGAREMIAETKVSRLLGGWRGAPAADVEALANAISAISTFASADGMARDFEVNPLRVLEKGVVALDALIT
jgi:acyl-CoA synthetase (NDP forming)